MTKTKRNVGALILFMMALVILILFLYPCGPGEGEHHDETGAAAPAPSRFSFFKKKNKAPEHKPETHDTTTLPNDKAAAIEEIDNSPPVTLTGGEELPDVSRCATTHFPPEASDYVKRAIVTVRLIVDKFGKVKSVSPLSVDLPEDLAEDMAPPMRKAFMTAGKRAFGEKRCPPHVVDGEKRGYSMEVPLVFKLEKKQKPK